VLLETVLAALGQAGASAPAVRELARTLPAKDSSGAALPELAKAADKRMKDIGATGTRPVRIELNTPTSFKDSYQNQDKYAGYSTRVSPDGTVVGGQIKVNPNASRDVLAHEMGHHVTEQTDIGNSIAKLRHNPKAAIALGAAVLGLPFMQAALQEGDDDYAAGIAISALASSPTLINEALATKNGLAIMKEAGMPATPGARGRMAGAFMSYAAAPLVAGLAGGSVGNLIDDHTAIYNV